MKSKATLSLMEQVVMLLVFALAAAVCLRVFVASSDLSVAGEVRSHAATAVQNAAETLKICRGDLREHAAVAGGTVTEEGWRTAYNEEWKHCEDGDASYMVGITPVEDEQPLLGSALVWAKNEGGEIIFEMTVCWQEETDG